MHAREVQRVVAIANAQEACGLFKGLGTQAGHVQQLLAVLETAIGLTPAHDAAGHRIGEARDLRQQRRRSGVQVHTH